MKKERAALLALALLACVMPTAASERQVGLPVTEKQSEKDTGWLPQEGDLDVPALQDLLPRQETHAAQGGASIWEMPVFTFRWGEDLPVRWYAGDYGKKPAVRQQGKFGTCWALTAASAMEAVLRPAQQLVFAADHISLANAFTADVNEGGDYLMLMAYLSGWQGPVLEADDPYGDAYSPEGLSPAVHVQEIQVLEQAQLEQLKQAVYTYGAVQTSLYMDRASTEPDSPYYNEETDGYYYFGTQIQNHDVLILGWDDTYSRFNFKTPPSADGALICQNTWGDDFGEDGIFYVSYEDANIGETGVVYSRIDPVDNYSRIYQTDDCGWQGNQGYDDDTCWFANVYTAQEAEQLAAFGLYATAGQASCELYVVKNFENEASFRGMQHLQSAKMEQMGYYTVDLGKPVQLAAGERFAVVVKMTTPGSVNPAAVEYRSDQYTQQVTLEGKNGYLSRDGQSWYHTEKTFGTNVCLKAYTRKNP